MDAALNVLGDRMRFNNGARWRAAFLELFALLFSSRHRNGLHRRKAVSGTRFFVYDDKGEAIMRFGSWH